jgi:PAS domain S-box-containing protein
VTIDFADLVKQLPTPIWVWNDAGRYVYANPAAHELLGYKGNELLEMGVFDVCSESRDVVIRRIERMRLNGAWQGDCALRNADGLTIPVRGNTVAMKTPGGQTLYVSSPRVRHADVTRNRYRLSPRESDVLELVAWAILTSSLPGNWASAFGPSTSRSLRSWRR